LFPANQKASHPKEVVSITRIKTALENRALQIQKIESLEVIFLAACGV
jgi:hypothetical protein